MAASLEDDIDPRVRRTRQLLRQGLETLLQRKSFDSISVQDIAEAATVNRVTFYDHYPDKFALLECVVAGRFEEMLRDRGVTFEGNCGSALKAIVLCVCDYLAGVQEKLETYLESAVIAVVRRMIWQGLRRHSSTEDAALELRAAAVSWAIYGAARDWVRMAERPSAEEVSETIAGLLAPVMHPAG